MSERNWYTDWTPETRRAAREMFKAVTDGGSVELAICVVCGYWCRWESDVPGDCVDGTRHRMARVRVSIEDPDNAE